MNRCFVLKPMIFFASFLMLLSTSNAQVTLVDIDFDGNDPLFDYSFAYAGHGEGDPNVNVDDSADVSDSLDNMATGNPGFAGCATGDFTGWNPPDPNNYTYAGVGYGFGIDLTSPLASSNLADYDVSFDASGSGMVNVDGRIDVVFRDAAGNLVLSLRQTGLSYGSTFSNFNVNLASMMLVSGTTQANFDAMFANVTRFEVAIVAQTNLANAGMDADNTVCADNLNFTGPVPEPGGAMLLLFGVLGLAKFRRR